MDDPGAFYAVALHAPHFRASIAAGAARPRERFLALRRAVGLCRALARSARHLAAAFQWTVVHPRRPRRLAGGVTILLSSAD
jgi:hypothetical protein